MKGTGIEKGTHIIQEGRIYEGDTKQIADNKIKGNAM